MSAEGRLREHIDTLDAVFDKAPRVKCDVRLYVCTCMHVRCVVIFVIYESCFKRIVSCLLVLCC